MAALLRLEAGPQAIVNIYVGDGGNVAYVETYLMSGRRVGFGFPKRSPFLYLELNVRFCFGRLGVPLDRCRFTLQWNNPAVRDDITQYLVTEGDRNSPFIEVLRKGLPQVPWAEPTSLDDLSRQIRQDPLVINARQTLFEQTIAHCVICEVLCSPLDQTDEDVGAEAFDLSLNFGHEREVNACRAGDEEYLVSICNFAEYAEASRTTNPMAFVDLAELVDGYSGLVGPAE